MGHSFSGSNMDSRKSFGTWSIPQATALLQSKQFATLLPPFRFICLLDSVPKATPAGFEISQVDHDRFRTFLQGGEKFRIAEKLFKKRKKQAEVDSAEED